MSNKVDELVAQIEILSAEINKIQKDCTHTMVVLGFEDNFKSDHNKEFNGILVGRKIGSKFFYSPIDSSKKGQEFSVGRSYDFYSQCAKCSKIERHTWFSHCPLCLHTNFAAENIINGVSMKECLNCYTKICWVRSFGGFPPDEETDE